MKTVRYYAIYYDENTYAGPRWVETIETRKATRLVASQDTGVQYRSFPEADKAIAAKNQGYAI